MFFWIDISLKSLQNRRMQKQVRRGSNVLVVFDLGFASGKAEM